MSSTTSINNGMAAKRGENRSALRTKKARLGSRPGTFKTLLVPTDFSTQSETAFRQALDLAEQFDGSVHLLHVVEKRTLTTLDSDPLMPPEKSLIAAAKNKLVAFAQQSSDAHPVVPVFPVAKMGDPWREIVRTARDRKAGAIVLGTRGYSGLKHVLLGSVAERVVRHAPCTVVVVRPPQSPETAPTIEEEAP